MMKTKTFSRIPLVTGVATAMCVLGVILQAGNPVPAARQYLIAKGVHYMQTGTGAPVLATNDEPYQAMANVDPISAVSISSVSLLIPGGDVLLLSTNEDDSQWEIKDSFASKSLMDAGAPNGTYKFTIVGSDGTHMPSLSLTGDTYPNTPHISNWAELQNADSTGPIRITWDAFTGGTVNDFVQIFVEDDMGNGYSSEDIPGAPGALNGTNTYFDIPANTLQGGGHFSGTLLFARGTFNSTAYPGVQGIAAYFKDTSFSLTTTSAPPAAGRFRFAQTAYSVNEDASNIKGGGAVLTILRAGGSSGSASVLVTTRPGTAFPDTDYLSYSNRITFADGVQSVDLDPIYVVDHSTLDGNKTFFATLSSPAGGADLGIPAEATVTIVDTEVRSAGIFGFSAPVYTVSEGLTNVAVTVTRSGGASGVVSIFFHTTDGSAEAGDDFVQTEGTLVFSNGVTSRVINIPIIKDDIDETNETFTISLINPTGGAALSTHDTATIVIKDDDTAGVISFSALNYSVIESETNFPVIVRRTGGSADEVSVDLVITGGTATRGDDYDHNGGTSVTLHFEKGVMAITSFFAVHDDHEAEGDETILLTLRNPEGGARLAGITNATVHILDDEVTLQFSASSYTNKETAGAAVIFVERTGPLNVPASVHFRTGGGSARPGVDYVQTNVLVEFPAGVKKKPVVIKLINDFLVEDPEDVDLVLEDPSENALLGPRSEASLVILSEDLGGVIQFGPAVLKVVESRPFLSVVILRSGGLASNVTVRLTTSEGSARDGEDYIGTNVTLTFGPRETVKTIHIPIVPDAIVEGLETFNLTLSNPTGGATLGERSTRIASILDDDVGGVISFARPEFIVNENGTNAVVIVNRVGGAASNVVVRLTASDGTATDPDYVSFDRVLTFGAGERSKTNLIGINNDIIAEGAIPETINLTLREFGGGGRPGLSNAVIRIVDDESSVSFTNGTASVTEGKVLTLAVARAGALTTQVTVDYMTMDGTATAGVDYRGTNGTLTFPPNVAVRFITVGILNDSATETNDHFTVVLKNPLGGVLLGLTTNVDVTLRDAPDPAAESLTGSPEFKVTIHGVTNTSVNVSFSATTSLNASLNGGGFLSIIGTHLLSNFTPQTLTLGVDNVTGPGVYSLTESLGGDLSYSSFTPLLTYGTTDPGTHGTVTIDGLTASRAAGRFDIIMNDDADGTKFVRAIGRFRVDLPH